MAIRPEVMPSQEFSLHRLLGLFDLSRPDTFWRHDVDYDYTCALAMAIAEHTVGIKATYYFRSLEYDVRSSEFIAALERIKELGHEVALHVDLFLGRDAVVNKLYVLQQCEVQKRAFRGMIDGRKISIHQPPRDALWRSYLPLDHAMSPAWEGNVVADSRGVFRLSPEKMLQRYEATQINLHPEWWFLPKEQADAMRIREAGNP